MEDDSHSVAPNWDVDTYRGSGGLDYTTTRRYLHGALRHPIRQEVMAVPKHDSHNHSMNGYANQTDLSRN